MKTMKNSLVGCVAVLLVLAATGAHATPMVADDLVLADATACTRPRLAPPPRMKDS